jgi:hypothetical protein
MFLQRRKVGAQLRRENAFGATTFDELLQALEGTRPGTINHHHVFPKNSEAPKSKISITD